MKFSKKVLLNKDFRYFVKWIFLFTLLFLSIFLGSLQKIISSQNNPFFYENF